MLFKAKDQYNHDTIIGCLSIKHIQRRNRDVAGCIVSYIDGSSITLATSYEDVMAILGPHMFRSPEKDEDATAERKELPAD